MSDEVKPNEITWQYVALELVKQLPAVLLALIAAYYGNRADTTARKADIAAVENRAAIERVEGKFKDWRPLVGKE